MCKSNQRRKLSTIDAIFLEMEMAPGLPNYKAAKDAIKAAIHDVIIQYGDFRTMENDSNSIIEGEEYTQGYNDAIREQRDLMRKFTGGRYSSVTQLEEVHN